MDLVGEAERRIIDAIKKDQVREEPKITERFVESIRTLLDAKGSLPGFKLRMISVPSMGTNTLEEALGADMCVVADIRFRNFRQTKGFLWQAKREDSWLSVKARGRVDPSLDHRGLVSVSVSHTKQFKRLKQQAANMLKYTPDSFGLIYGEKGFVTVPASSITGLVRNDEVQGMNITRFFREFLLCFIGDTKLRALGEGDLKTLVKETNSKLGVLFKIEGRGDDAYKEGPHEPPVNREMLALMQGTEPEPIPV